MALTKAQLIDLNGNELILDLNGNTSLTADTDDQIDIKIGGADDFTFTANAFNVLTGSHATFADSANAKFGTGSDMLVYHDGSNSYITNAVGALKIATETSGIALTIGHTTSEVTIADNLTVTGTLTLGSGAELTEAELEFLDGITAGTAAASKALVLDGSKNIATIGTIASAAITSSGIVTATGFTAGSAVLAEAELEMLDGITAGTAAASKALVLDGSKNIATIGTIASAAITSSGIITGTAFTAGSAVLAEAELELLDGLTAGTAIASKVVTTDGSIDTTGQRNLTITGELDAATGDFSGVVDVAGAFTTGSTIVSTGKITSDAGIDIDNFNIDGTTIALSSGDLTVDVAGDIILDAAGDTIFLKDAGTTFGSLDNNSANLIIKSGTTTALTFTGANVTAAGTIGSGAITSTGIVTGTAFTAGSAVLAEAELELLDGLTAGTAIASKVVTTDASIDTSGQRNLTISGELDAATLDISGAIDIAGNSQFSGTIKVGAAATPGGVVAITTADSGATAHADADELVMENAGVAGLSILSFNNNYGNIYFGDGQDNDIGKITYLHTDNSMSFTTNTAIGLKIDSAGIVSKPLQPVFLVRPSSDQADLATGATDVAWGAEIFDVGANFASNTFTAPVTGKYQFNVSLYLSEIDIDTTLFDVVMIASNRQQRLMAANFAKDFSADGNNFHSMNASTILDMDASDTVTVRINITGGGGVIHLNGGAPSSAFYTAWSGALIC
jgi:hypothetical protein